MRVIALLVFVIIGPCGLVVGDSLDVRANPAPGRDRVPAREAETSDWGKGIFFESRIATAKQMELGLGYSFWIDKSFPLRRPYTGNLRGSRLGISAGLKALADEVIFAPEASSFYHSDALGPYVKIAFGSPILRDLVSVSTHLKAMYLSRLSTADDHLTKNALGLGFGGTLNFWLYRNMSVDLGLALEGTIGESDGRRDQPLLQHRIRSQFGITLFF